MISTDQFLTTPRIFGLGFEKCGTTLLDELIRRSPIALVPKKKETFYFTSFYERGIEYYQSLYPSDHAGQFAYIVDITPIYLYHAPVVLPRIQEFDQQTNRRSKYIICLRSHVYRAFSHYVHELYHHHSRLEMRNSRAPYSLSFFDEFERKNRRFFQCYADQVSQTFDMMKRENVLVLINELDFADVKALNRRVSEFLGVECGLSHPRPQNRVEKFLKKLKTTLRKQSATPRVFEGRFPVYHFRRETPFSIPSGNDSTQPQPGHLYLDLANGVVDLGTPTELEAVLVGYRAWTRSLAGHDAEKIQLEYFERDRKELERLLNRDLSCWLRFDDVHYGSGTNGS
jgi:Sulfotransferase domain